jgi:hypothetical protein
LRKQKRSEKGGKRPFEKSEMAEQGTLSFKQTGDARLEVYLAGAWRLRGGLPSAALVKRELESAPTTRHIGFEAGALTSWDSATGPSAGVSFAIPLSLVGSWKVSSSKHGPSTYASTRVGRSLTEI